MEILQRNGKHFCSVNRKIDVVFIKNLMNNEKSKAVHDDIEDMIAGELNVEKLMKSILLENIVACNSFELIDENIIDWIISKIEDNMFDAKITEMTIPEIC